MRNIDEYDEAYWTQAVADDPWTEDDHPLSALSRKLGVDLNDPMTRWARTSVREKNARSVRVRCAFGHCIIIWDPVSREDRGGFGPVGCPCQSLPGASARHLDQRPKPRMAVKAVGRNGSRVMRSARRHAGIGKSGLMRWAEQLQAD